SVSTGVLLPTTLVPTLAAVSTRHHGHVSELSRHTESSPPQAPVQDDRPTDPGTQVDHHDVFQAPSRPDPYLRPGTVVCVVLHDHGQTQEHRQCVQLGFVTPGQVRREQDTRTPLVDEPGRPHSHGANRVLGAQLLHHLHDGFLHHRGAPAPVRRLGTHTCQDPPLRRDHTGGDLGPPDVHPDGQFLLRPRARTHTL